MKLYHSTFTRSGRARWMLEELGVDYEIERIAFASGDHKKPEYLAIHPLGMVPALVDGDDKLFESSAILMHLADKFPDKQLAPALGTPLRARYYKFMVYVPATVDPVLETITMHTRMLPEAKRIPQLVEEAGKKLVRVARVLEEAVNGRSYVIGDTFSAADIVVGSAIAWMGFVGKLGDFPRLNEYLKRMQARPAFVRAHAD